MNRLFSLSMIALVATTIVISPAMAQNYHHNNWNQRRGDNINSTQAVLQSRINQGIRDGRLNRQEASHLQNKISQIAVFEARKRNSGNRLSYGERNSLMTKLNNLNNEITRELNDFDHRRIGYWNNNYRRNFQIISSEHTSHYATVRFLVQRCPIVPTGYFLIHSAIS